MSSPHVPAELQDHVVDHLHDSEDALKRCCLVSKSWVPRARKHLFADITLRTAGDLQSWKRTFSDSSASPARYTKALLVGHPQAVTAADAEEGGWISTFSRVVRFHVEIHGTYDYQCLVPFHGFSPALESLTVVFSTLPPSCVFDFIRSFPLLENLTVATYGGHPNIVDMADDDLDEQMVEIQSSSPPAFTGSLELSMDYGMEDIVVRLLLLPNGLCFQKLSLGWEHEDGISLARELIERCGSTLESLSISNSSLEISLPGPIDLLKTRKLKGVMLMCALDPSWITLTLRTITRDHKNLQRVAIDASDTAHEAVFDHDQPIHPGEVLGDTAYKGWLELDGLLAQLWESHSICLEVLYDGFGSVDENGARSWMECLLPEVIGKRKAALVGIGSGWVW